MYGLSNDGDMWEEGYGAALCGVTDWPAVVAGRFLKGWERKALAAGWRSGLKDAEAYRRDMAGAVDVYAAAEAEGEPIPY
jgi:hypothetical protein